MIRSALKLRYVVTVGGLVAVVLGVLSQTGLVTSILRYNAAQLRLLTASGLLDPDVVR